MFLEEEVSHRCAHPWPIQSLVAVEDRGESHHEVELKEESLDFVNYEIRGVYSVETYLGGEFIDALRFLDGSSTVDPDVAESRGHESDENTADIVLVHAAASWAEWVVDGENEVDAEAGVEHEGEQHKEAVEDLI